MDERLRMFGANLYLIIGALVLLGLLLVLVVAAWTGIRVALWERQRRRAARQDKALRRRPDGRAYPPAGRGLCDRCNQVRETVYHLPSGERCCPTCYTPLPEEAP